MAFSPLWTCGSECGYTAGLASGVSDHYDLATIGAGGAITSDAVVFHPGGGLRSLKVVSATAITYAQSPIAVGTTRGMLRSYVYFNGSLPDITGMILMLTTATGSTGDVAQVRYNPSSTKLEAIISGGTAAGAVTVVANTWYCITMLYDVSATTYTLDWWVDGVAQTQATRTGQTIGTVGKARFGVGTASVTATVNYDHMIYGTAGAAEPDYGGGVVVGYVPSACGTHSFTAGDFQNDANAAITAGETTSWQKLDEVPIGGGSDFVKQVVLRNTSYLEYVYATASETRIPRAVEQVCSFHNVGTLADIQVAQLYDGVTSTQAYSASAGTSSSIGARTKQWATDPTGSAWSTGRFTALRLRWGFSTDVTDVPALDATILEAEFSPSVSASAGNAAGTGAAGAATANVGAAGGNAAGTGAAGSLSSKVSSTAGSAAGTGAASTPAASVAVNAGVATGTGAAANATGAQAVSAAAGNAAGTGAAAGITADIKTSGGVATGTGVASQPVASSSMVAQAGVATGTGAALAPTPSVGVAAGRAAGTGQTFSGTQDIMLLRAPVATGVGQAFDPFVQVPLEATPSVAAGTGAALAPGPSVSVNAGVATGTGTAANAAPVGVGVTSAVGIAAFGVGAAQDPSIAVITAAGAATGTGTAATPSVKATAEATGAATGVGAASTPSVGLAATAGAATGTGAASGTTAKVSPGPQAATGTGAALSPTIIATPHVSAAADNAFGTGSAGAAKASVGSSAGQAAGTGAASGATTNVKAGQTVAAGTGAAFDAHIITLTDAAVTPGVAEGTGVAYTTGASVVVNAGVATGTGAASDPVANIGAAAGVSQGTGAVYAVALAVILHAEVAAALGVAANAAIALEVQPGAATGFGAAIDPGTGVDKFVLAGLAEGTGEAFAVDSVGMQVGAGAAAGAGAAYDPKVHRTLPTPFSTARDGGWSITQ